MICRVSCTPTSRATRVFADRRRGVLAAVLGLLVLVAYGPTLRELLDTWLHRPEYGHGLLMPPIAAWMVWTRRRQLAAVVRRDTAASAWFALAAALAFLPLAGLLMLGEMKLSQALKPYALVATLAAGVAVVYGWRGLRALVAPLTVLLLMCPLPFRVHTELTLPLKHHAAVLATGLMDLSGLQAGLEGNMILVPGIKNLFVADACSGLRSLVSLLSVAVLASLLWRRHWSLKLVVVASALPLAIAVNAVRIWLTAMLSVHVSPAFADGFLHLFEGFLLFGVAAALLLGWAWFLGHVFPARPRVARAPRAPVAHVRAIPFRWIHRLAVAVVLLTSTAAVGGVYGIRSSLSGDEPDSAAIAGLEARFRRLPLALGAYSGEEIQWDEGIVAASGADAHRAVLYQDATGRPVQLFLGGAVRNAKNFHSPNVCLPAAGWETVESQEVPFTAFPAPGARMQRLRLQRGGEELLVYYWFQAGRRIVKDELTVRLLRLEDMVRGERLSAVLIGSVYVPVVKDTVEAEATAARFLRAIGPSLQRATVPGEELDGN